MACQNPSRRSRRAAGNPPRQCSACANATAAAPVRPAQATARGGRPIGPPPNTASGQSGSSARAHDRARQPPLEHHPAGWSGTSSAGFDHGTRQQIPCLPPQYQPSAVGGPKCVPIGGGRTDRLRVETPGPTRKVPQSRDGNAQVEKQDAGVVRTRFPSPRRGAVAGSARPACAAGCLTLGGLPRRQNRLPPAAATATR